MTALGSGMPGRETMTDETPRRGIGWQIAAIMLIGLVFRLMMAYAHEPLRGSGFGNDLGLFRYWAETLATHGPLGFYENASFADYTPGYLYALWVVGIVGNVIGGVGDLIKLPAILTDIALGYIVYSMVRELGVTERRATIAGAVVIFNPITWFDSVIWGQVDSFGDGVPAACHPRAVARPERAIGDPGRGRRADQAAAGDPRPDRRRRHDPARAVAGRGLGRRGRPAPHGLRLGAARRRPGPDPDDRPGRARDRGGDGGAVRPVGRVVLDDGPVPRLVAAAPGVQHRGPVLVRDGQRLQPLGPVPGGRHEHGHERRLDPRCAGAGRGGLGGLRAGPGGRGRRSPPAGRGGRSRRWPWRGARTG